jgi:hypothetical protein
MILLGVVETAFERARGLYPSGDRVPD